MAACQRVITIATVRADNRDIYQAQRMYGTMIPACHPQARLVRTAAW